jgi:hypothetical protein
MLCISLWQPWATLWVKGVKIHETRRWPTNVRGPVAVHAAKHKSIDERDFSQCAFVRNLLGVDYDDLPFGAIVGRVDLVSCQRTVRVYDNDANRMLSLSGPHPDVPVDWYLGNYAPCDEDGKPRYAWKAEQPFELKTPVPFKGSQGFFEIPDFEELRSDAARNLL